MELTVTKILNYDSYNPTPKLKSSPIPISFVSFNANDCNCIHCGDEYTMSPFSQYYCEKCLLCYLDNTTYKNLYVDAYILAENLIFPSNFCGILENYLAYVFQVHYIFCFKQIPNVIESEKYCKQCGKSLYQETNNYDYYEVKMCSDCYLISSECIESTLTKKPTTILYLPWWLNINRCNSCNMPLKFTSDRQKYCENCFTFYIGCRYCLTTNIVFGITSQSQCKKCKRVSSIIFDITKISSGNSDLDDFLDNSRLEIYNQLKLTEFTDKIKNIVNYFIPNKLFSSIYENFSCFNSKVGISMEWISYSQFINVKEIARGGFGIIYLATWLDGSIEDNYYNRVRHGCETVILKKFKNSQDISKYFLNELKSNQFCYKFEQHIIRTYGFTKDPKFDDYILVMQYASGGDLHNWIQENFLRITWSKQKLVILWEISEGLETIHKADYVHRDFHSGNILFNLSNKVGHQWQIGDLGLSQPANSTSNNEIYGVIPYIAPEIFKGSPFSKKSDVYCMGMIMWELTAGCKPFANVEHDFILIFKILDGERPEITLDTPECFANLMKSCWDPDPEKRPSMKEVRNTLVSWSLRNINIEQFIQAEIKRKELIKSKKLPKFINPHSKAIYTSRLLSFFISKCSSIYSSKGIC
ncbi:Mkk2p [Rhizophagus irregularis DAOM 197198w]|uniref:Mkk2p n=3 Tax=Rhizophagus irregularis TaxID=588596 RepID=A0A015LEY8_RHIIW|nr:Mkk2p [Rhizophagus irregularis DAOM 197198w]